jgi:hypothetical protein
MQRRCRWRRRVCLLVCCLIGTSLEAYAHLGGAVGLRPFVDEGVIVGGATTWGVIGLHDGGFAQTCEEALGSVPVDVVRLRDGDVVTLVAATDQGLTRSVDDGCSWQALTAVQGQRVGALSATTSTRLWAITSNAQADRADDNVLITSDDGGETFAIVFTFAHAVPTSLVVERASDGGERVLVAGRDQAQQAPRLWRSDGSAFSPFASGALEGAQLTRALAIDDHGLWFSTLDRLGRGHLFVAAVDDLDGAAAVEVGSFDGIVGATDAVAGHRFVTAAGGVVFRAPDSGVAITPGQWQRTTDGPLECLRRVPGDEGLWGCGRQSNGAWFVRTLDGVSWAPVFPFDEVTSRRCPDTTPGSQACAYRFVPAPGEGDDVDVDDDDEIDVVAPTGSCAQGSMETITTLAGALGVAWVFVTRRRRRR